MSQITKRLRDQIKTRLADPATGFNVTYNALAANTYDIPATSAIDFDGGSGNFFLAQVDPETLSGSSTVRWPAICLYGVSADDTNEQKFQEFSGDVIVALDYHINSKHAKVQYDFESESDCVEDTIVQIMNREANQTWDVATVYNGNVSWLRSPLKMAGQGFRQMLRFTMRFQVQNPT